MAGISFDRDMSAAEACELGRRAIYHATFRDAVSGGTVSGALEWPLSS
jgi:20S proteasome alpha/beta subunit